MKRFTKPKIVTKYQNIFDKHKIPKYSPDVVGKVGGRMFMGGKKVKKENECGKMGNGISDSKAGRMGNGISDKKSKGGESQALRRSSNNECGGAESKESLLDILKSRLNKWI